MAPNVPGTSLTSERIRSAAKHLEQDARRLQPEFYNNASLFKLVAEEMETEHDSEAVAMLRQGLLEVLDCAHRLEHQCSTLQNISQRFEAGTEFTDFSKHLNESTQQLLAANPFDPAKDSTIQQFDRAIWNVHHAGEVAPGQEEEDIVVMNNESIRNTKCPVSGRPVIELENPVRSTDCRHIYDELTAMTYISKASKRGQQCKCAVAGCSKFLKKDNMKCDPSLKIDINEFRRREQATQMAEYTELDLDDEPC